MTEELSGKDVELEGAKAVREEYVFISFAFGSPLAHADELCRNVALKAQLTAHQLYVAFLPFVSSLIC